MLTFKHTILILICFLMAGCIGPFYNPYPLSKLVAKVGPPLKLNTMSVEEQINAEIQAEAKTENSDEIKQNSQENKGLLSLGGVGVGGGGAWAINGPYVATYAPYMDDIYRYMDI